MKTSPSRIASALRFIADGIDGSEEPSISLVAHDLKYVKLALEGLGPDEIAVRMADDEGGKSTETLIKLLWSNPEGRSVEDAYGMVKKQVDDDKLVTALKGLQTSVSDFVTHLEHNLGRGKDKKTTRQQIREDEESGDVVTSAPPRG